MVESEIAQARLRMLRLLPLLQRLRRMIFDEEPEHFTKTQWNILITLFSHEDMTMTQIAEHIGASKEQTTRAMGPLVDEGLAQRFISPENRARVHVCLSQAGRARVQAMLADCVERLDALMESRLSPAEQDALREHLVSSAGLLEKIVAG